MRKAFFGFPLFLFTLGLCFSQSASVDYNDYYRFPLSLGIEYQDLSPFADYASTYNIFDLSANLRWPIPSNPVFQPSLRIGMMSFDNQDLTEPLKWDSTNWYGLIGAAYSNRFQKNFEIGGELMAGLSQAVFPDLLPDLGPVGNLNLLFEAGGRISLNPSYSMSIDIHPSLKYLYTLGDLTDYNGFIFGIGFSASYRFGEDPDAPTAIIRSLKFSETDIPDLFAAMQSYYVKNPIGTISITNTENHDIEDLEVSFFQAGFMDTPTPAASIPVLKGKETVKVPIFASFNREVFSVEGITPLTGEIIASYTSRGKPAEQKTSVTYDLHDKTSMVWDDDRKVAAFITPADSALRNYASFIRQSCKDSTIPAYSEPMQFAVQVFHALGEIGCLYQVDPTLPFTEVQENLMVVDSISLPRTTLKNITGDCDDLTVLYCSLLETVGISTAFITIPGHIYAAYNTKVAARDYEKIHPNRKMTISIDGELWVPVEITMIGKTGFLEAWRTGIEEWTRYDNEATVRAFYKTRDSQDLYRPVGLTETDLGLQYGNSEAIDKGFNSDMDKIIAQVVAEYADKAKKTGKKQDYNRLGIVYAQFQRYRQAKTAFNKVISLDPEFTGAKINVGNLEFLTGNYGGAAKAYEAAVEKLDSKGRGKSSTALKVLINLARTNYMLEHFEEADSWFTRAKNIDPAKTEEYAYLATGGNGTGRAAEEQAVKDTIIFVDE